VGKNNRASHSLLARIKSGAATLAGSFKISLKLKLSMVVHASNPSYLGGKDQDCSSKPSWAKG
jgi:hypothetical protein